MTFILVRDRLTFILVRDRCATYYVCGIALTRRENKELQRLIRLYIERGYSYIVKAVAGKVRVIRTREYINWSDNYEE